MIKLLIFDLDGTLIDSAPDIVTTANKIATGRGLRPFPAQTIINAIGEGLMQFVLELFPESARDPGLLMQLEKEFLLTYESHLLDQTRLFDGVESFLDASDLLFAIVSNKKENLVRKVVAGLPLSRFRWFRLLGADSLPARKPHPLPLLQVMKEAAVQSNETLMIGDGIPDMLAAAGAGVRSVAVEFGYTDPEILYNKGARYGLRHFRELPDIIARASAES